MGWCELFWKSDRQPCRVLRRMRSPVVVLKLGSCADQPFVSLETRKLVLENAFFQINPCIKFCFPQIKLWPYPWFTLCIILCSYPSVGVVGLAEYVCTHPILNFYRGRSRLRSRRRWVGYRPAPSLACGFGSPAGVTACRKTLMIFSLFLIS